MLAFKKNILFSAIFPLTSIILSTEAAETGTLATTVVQAESENIDNKSYTVKKSSIATKMNLSLKETPQSVSVITSQQIEDQNLTNINDILLQTPGVSATQHGQIGAGYSSYYSRGFEITNVLRDGMPVSETNYGRGGDFLGLENSALYERVEITEFQGKAKLSYGSWDNINGQVDVSSGLNEDNSIRGRLVTSYGQGENQQDRFNQKGGLVYAALDFDLTNKTLLTTALTYQTTNVDNATVHGFPATSSDEPIQEQVTFGKHDNSAGDFTYTDTERINLFLGLEHDFSNGWKGIANYTYTKADSDRVYGVSGSGSFVYSTGIMSHTAGRYESSPDTHSIDLYASGDFTAFERQHTFSFGVNGYSVEADDPSYGRVIDFVEIDGWNGYVENRTPITENGRSEVEESQIGAFAAINLQLTDPLKLVLGGRISNWERINNKGDTTEQSQEYNGEITPYLGLIYDINENFSAYTSYTSIFNPNSRKDVNGTYLDPEEGNSTELGLKAALYDGLFNASIAYFVTNQDNKGVADGDLLTPDGNQAYKSIDGAEVKGWDLTVSGQISPDWNISGGYSYSDAKDEEGEPLSTSIPKQTFKVFTTYQYDKLTIGGGINWQSKIYSSYYTGIARDYNTQEAYALVNAMAKYEVNKNVNVLFNINNLFDKEYALNTGASTWGAERNVTLSVDYTF